jgi:hypothetical protein
LGVGANVRGCFNRPTVDCPGAATFVFERLAKIVKLNLLYHHRFDISIVSLSRRQFDDQGSIVDGVRLIPHASEVVRW